MRNVLETSFELLNSGQHWSFGKTNSLASNYHIAKYMLQKQSTIVFRRCSSLSDNKFQTERTASTNLDTENPGTGNLLSVLQK